MIDNFLELTKLITPATLVPLFPLIGFLLIALFGKQLNHVSGLPVFYLLIFPENQILTLNYFNG